MKKVNVQKIATIALLIAIEIILTRFLSIQTPIVRISFGFLPIAVVAMMYGPVYAGTGAVIADLIGITLFPTGAFFPGFTLTAFLTGAVYGIILYNRPKTMPRICLAALIVVVALQFGLDTVWLEVITGKGYIALMPPRAIKALIMLPIQVICIRAAVSGRIRLNLPLAEK